MTSLSSNLKILNDKNPLKLWIACDTSLDFEPFKQEYECYLLKKGKIFTNTYKFLFFSEFILVTKVS